MRPNASTSYLAPMKSDPEQILRCIDDQTFYMTFKNPQHAVQELAVTLEATLELDDEITPSRLIPSPGVPSILHKSFNNQRLRTTTIQTAQEKARRIHALEMD